MKLPRTLFVATAFVVCAVSPLPGRAQSDPNIQRIWRLGMDSSHLCVCARAVGMS